MHVIISRGRNNYRYFKRINLASFFFFSNIFAFSSSFCLFVVTICLFVTLLEQIKKTTNHKSEVLISLRAPQVLQRCPPQKSVQFKYHKYQYCWKKEKVKDTVRERERMSEIKQIKKTGRGIFFSRLIITQCELYLT
jgi:hypothetical protein